MITPEFVQTMSRYNAWQNGQVFDAANKLSDEQRREDRGAFFKSIDATLNHILWADQMWLMRFGASPAPRAKSIQEGLTQYPSWDELGRERNAFDDKITSWASSLDATSFDGDIEWYSAAVEQTVRRPKRLLIIHLFNHQTHHRGQVNAMLTGFGIKPGVTDLPFSPMGADI